VASLNRLGDHNYPLVRSPLFWLPSKTMWPNNPLRTRAEPAGGDFCTRT